jgi:dipeptidyl aminopeptidase/acylaminoacyl peptidase
MTRRWWRGPSIAVAVMVLAAGLSAQSGSQRSMTLVDLMEVPRVIDPQLSPDGRAVLYQLNRADWKANRRVGHIWRQDLAGGPPVQLTFGDTGETTPRWSPDGKTILFLARRGENPDTQIHVMPADGGEAKALTRHATGVASPVWAPDSSAVYFLASDAKTADDRERERLRDDAYAFEENYKQRHLWKVTVATAAEQRITNGDASVLDYRLSRDGRRLALHRAPSPLVGESYRSEVWVMDATGENGLALTSNAVEETEAQLSPDNTQVLFIAEANRQFEPYYSSTVFVAPAGGGQPRALLPDFKYPIDRAAWGPDGRSILAVVNMGVHSEIFQIDVAAAAARQLTDGRHAIQFWSLAPEAARMVWQFDEPTRFGDVWTLAVPTDRAKGTAGAEPTRVTGVYDAYARDFRLPRQDKITWKSPDGTTIEGLMFRPLDEQPGRPAPLVVQMHGGPQDSDKFGFWGWNDYIQVLTAKGYAVLRPNYRGSTGYGNAFLRDMVGGYFKNAHLDVLAGVDFLIKEGIADPDRLVLMGFSAGAHLTNKLITYTDRFKAASSAAGAANWTSMYAQTDTRVSRNVWFGGTPWQKNAPSDVYWEQSPLKHVANVKTPTLFLAGESDARVPLPQSVEMHRALKANGVPTKLYVAPREAHNWGELRHQLFKGNAELEWFERFALGREYVWEKAPDGSK